MDGRKDTAIETSDRAGPGDIATVFGRAFELAMQIERERFLRAGPYKRTAERQGYANGYKPKRIDTPAGTVTVQVPNTAGQEGEPFYPQAIIAERYTVPKDVRARRHANRLQTAAQGGKIPLRSRYAIICSWGLASGRSTSASRSSTSASTSCSPRSRSTRTCPPPG
jgi:hypothetical protein